MGKGEPTISDVLGAIADLAKRITKLENRMEDKFNMIEERFNLLKSGQADLKTLIKTKVLEHDRKILALQRNTNFISDYMDSVEKFQKDVEDQRKKAYVVDEQMLNFGERIEKLEKISGAKESL